MLEPLFGSSIREQVLLYIHSMGRGYSREIARSCGVPQDSVQKQLKRLEEAGILLSEKVGRTVLYRFDEEYPLLREIEALLRRILLLQDGPIGIGIEPADKGESGPDLSARTIVRRR